MKIFRLLALSLIALMMFGMVSSTAAQGSYSFSMDREVVNVYWNSDGTESVDYVFSFTNDPSGHVIDFVDVGMPNGNYGDLYGTENYADVNGNSVSLSSDYQGQGSYGFSVDMGAYAIQPGQSGNLHVHVNRITDVLYKDTSDPDNYASGDFSPTWFGSQYIHGNSYITVIFHLPVEVQPDQPRYHNVQGGWPCSNDPATGYDDQNHIIYTWDCPSAFGSNQYTFGASFPSSYVPTDSIVVPPAFDIGTFIAGIGGFLQPVCCIGFFLSLFVGLPIFSAINQNKRKLAYLPPKIQIEGHGIKRGLTAVEAGILMEEPLDKVMTMVLFGVAKKNAATVISKDPLKLQVTQPQPADLHDYEKDFLAAFANDNLAERRKGLSEMTIKLVNSVSDKMKGFSRKETVAYYKDIMERAWQQIESAGTPEVKSDMYDQSLEWTMLDKNYDERTRRVFTGPVFMPMWWGNYDPTYHPSTFTSTSGAGASIPRSSASAPSSSGGRVSLPGSAMAASVVTGVQNFSSRILGDVKSFTSGVTNKTNPVPVAAKSSGSHWSGGGGGHSCACACACAGCACACAGGGR
jgi:hypothetical protein